MRNLTPWEYIMARRRFTLFSYLPVEIRDEIWRLTLEPRIVEVRPKKSIYDGFYSTAPLPVVLTVCKDSERAVLRLYPKYFGGALIAARIRFNAKIDTLYLDWKLQDHLRCFLVMISLQEAEKIQFLAIDQYIRWSRQSIDPDYCWSSAPVFEFPLTIFDLQTDFFKRCCHLVVDLDQNLRRIDAETLEQLCSVVRCMKKLKELIFVHDDIIWDEEFLKEGGVFPQQDELAGLTLFQPQEVYDLFPEPVEMIHFDYRESIEYYDDDMEIETLQDDLETKFASPKFEILVRYGWRFPDSLSLPSRQPRLTESE
ncbi:uncharacterized protein EAE97_010322 [Botrytis byssoidea]|uniref:2EXR domain-containing protein n=1 Tax=Botrytis byssoidea TaxID=139641 RepID=A0A9P5LK65_9HELO|nr:uncharacterized protein EAE97_010322 [Botrytis byssoidea]KAF7926022.1 hypothetical protein EAE97_010322 [Botrytis byssoidea]